MSRTSLEPRFQTRNNLAYGVIVCYSYAPAMKGDSLEQLLTTSEVAKKLNVGEDSLRQWRRSGEGPRALKLGHRTVRYRLEDVEAWLSTHEPANKETKK